MIKCKHCGDQKEESAMSIWNGKPSKVCLECKPLHPTGRAARGGNGGGGDTSKKRTAAVSRRKPKAAAALEIEVPGGGHGFKASITQEDVLHISQENAGADPDNIILTRSEARSIFELFGEWAAE